MLKTGKLLLARIDDNNNDNNNNNNIYIYIEREREGERERRRLGSNYTCNHRITCYRIHILKILSFNYMFYIFITFMSIRCYLPFHL